MIFILLLEANNIGNRFRRGLSATYLPEYVAFLFTFFQRWAQLLFSIELWPSWRVLRH